MKKTASILAKQRGFTILEALIGMVIFVIIIMGSGLMLKQTLFVQKEINVGTIVVNTIQERLQTASGAADVCDSVDKTPFAVANQNYYIDCINEQIDTDGITTYWPVIGVSTSDALAAACADGHDVADCYVIGR
jgi:prepilin-type N-terminal cleavage/methylation domain-containing protein